MKIVILVLTLALHGLSTANPINPDRPLSPRATPTCSTVLVSPIPTTLHCEEYGTLARPVPLAPASTIPASVPTPSIACRNACLANSACHVFGYTAAKRTCVEYGKTLAGMGFVQSSRRQGAKYSNRKCYKQVCTTPTMPSPTVCTPTSMPALGLADPSFEDTQSDGTSPPWQTQGAVNFVNDPTIATDGNYYADLIANGNGSYPPDQSGDITSITQTISGLDTTQAYLFNFTYIPKYIEEFADCYLFAYLGDEQISSTPMLGNIGPVPFGGNVVPPTETADLQIAFTCVDLDPRVEDAGEVIIDDIQLFQLDLSCLMYIQAVDPGNSSGVDGLYLSQTADSTGLETYTVFTADVSAATQYSLDSYGHMFFSTPDDTTYFWNQDDSAAPSDPQDPSFVGLEFMISALLAEDTTGLDLEDYKGYKLLTLVTCSIDPNTFLMTCSAYGQSYLSVIRGWLALGNENDTTALGWPPITLKITYVTHKSSI